LLYVDNKTKQKQKLMLNQKSMEHAFIYVVPIRHD
jgi:hypothetical protein